ncbi:unnamed protein product [Calicophoron daubneyi]|uniref:Cadherin domain-containing protein n=1 Tax=Calicophoron daubneyi TaxID=300641 RepID=A0AAV2SWH3_CALDB
MASVRNNPFFILTLSIFAMSFTLSLNSFAYRTNVPDLNVLENVTVGTVVLENIRSYLGLPSASIVKLGPGSVNQFFRLDSATGQLVSTNPVDLESPVMCQTEKSCCRREINEISNHQLINLASSIALKTAVPSKLAPISSDPLLSSNHIFTGEVQCKLMAFILAKTSADTQLSPITRIFVNIVDLNDNAPVFSSPTVNMNGPMIGNVHKPFHLSFLEGPGGLNKRQDLPTATDADFSFANRVKRYWLEWSLPVSGRTSEPQDRERLGSKLKSFVSVDEPNGLNWAILGPFRLIYLESGRTIALELDSELDREQQKEYRLHLVAEDGGGLRGVIALEIEVIDVNEFPPVFTNGRGVENNLQTGHSPGRIYRKHYTVKESLPIGNEVGRVEAFDEDRPPFGQITYRLGPGSPQTEILKTFSLHPTTGVLTLASELDYEKIKEYRLTIIAEDGGGVDSIQNQLRDSHQNKLTPVSLSSSAIVEVTVTDVNDNAPIIRFEKDDQDVNSSSEHTLIRKYQEVRIKEDVTEGSPIIFFSALDRDMGENGRVTCALGNGTDKFQMRELNGLFDIETLERFDRESVDRYYVRVTCQDHGNPPLQTDRVLVVHVEDVNDLPPSFPIPLYQFHVAENSPSGTRLKPINANYPEALFATDPDLNSTLTYTLEPSKPNHVSGKSTQPLSDLSGSIDHQLFRIDPVSGIITTQGELDREERSRLSFQVCANDGKHSACTDVVVLLDDVNDNRPRFDQDTYVIRVEENQLPHKPLISFKVSDEDSGNTGFYFDFIEDDFKDLPPLRQSSGGNNTELAVQQQTPQPGSLRYHFALRENTLYLRRPLDREVKSNYHFFVEITDVQEQPKVLGSDAGRLGREKYGNLSSRAEIFVDVGDANDNAPVFIFPNSTGPAGNRLSISCHETMGSSVGRLQATDADLGQNASIVFSLIHTPEVDQLFYLDSQSGELFVNTGQLTERCGESTIMVVSADDQGPPESKRSRPSPVERLLIKIEDKPTFAQMIAVEKKQQWHSLVDGADGRATRTSDDNGFVYANLSAKTVLSVVLGGSTVFLICLLILWMILLLYNRSKRRKRLLRVQQMSMSNQRPMISSPRLVTASSTPEKIQFGTMKTESSQCNTLPKCSNYSGGLNELTQSTEKPELVTFHQSPIPITLDYHRCIGSGELIDEHWKPPDRIYGSCRVRLATTNSTTLPRLSPTPSLPNERRSDYSTSGWGAVDCDNYQTCLLDHSKPAKTTLAGAARGKSNFKGKTVFREQESGCPGLTRRRNRKSESTFGRFFPKWILNNIAPQLSTSGVPEGCTSYTPTNIPCILMEGPSEQRNPQNLVDSDFASSRRLPPRPSIKKSKARTGKSTAICEPSSYNSFVDRMSADVEQQGTNLNNQHRPEQYSSKTYHRTSYPFLTPPPIRRDLKKRGICKMKLSGSPLKMLNKNCLQVPRDTENYDTLLGRRVRPCSSIPVLAYSHLDSCPLSGTPAPCFTEHHPIPSAYGQECGDRSTNSPNSLVPDPNYYRCWSKCDPNGTHDSSVHSMGDLLSEDDRIADRVHNCPQCQLMDEHLLHQGCHDENCSILRNLNGGVDHSSLSTNIPNTGDSDFYPLSGNQRQGSYMTVQDMLNSCV